MKMTRKIACFLCACFFAGAFCFAGDDETSDKTVNIFGSGEVFSLSPKKESLFLGCGVLLSGGDLILDNILKLHRLEYTGQTFDMADVNAFDRKLMRQYNGSLDFAGNFVLGGAVAVPCVLAIPEVLSFSGKSGDWAAVLTMYAETLLIANGIKEFIKLGVNRIRPYMYFDPSTYPQNGDIEAGDFANSFPSGHTTLAFAGATFASYCSAKYFPKSAVFPVVTCVSYALASATAVLRIAAGCHFATDVIVGAVLGSAVGFLVPFAHTFNKDNSLKMTVAPSALVFRVDF